MAKQVAGKKSKVSISESEGRFFAENHESWLTGTTKDTVREIDPKRAHEAMVKQFPTLADTYRNNWKESQPSQSRVAQVYKWANTKYFEPAGFSMPSLAGRKRGVKVQPLPDSIFKKFSHLVPVETEETADAE